MIVKLLIFASLSNSFIQAFPLLILKYGNEEVPCDTKITWYREINEKTKRLYNEYYAKLAEMKLKPNDLDLLNSEHKKLENTVSAVFQRYDVDYDRFESNMSNTSAKKFLCHKIIDWYQSMNVNLSRLTIDIGKELLHVLDHSESSFAQKKNINDFFGKLIDFLSKVVEPENQFKDLLILEKEWKVDRNNTAKTVNKVVSTKKLNHDKLLITMAIGKGQKSEDDTLPNVPLTITCLIFICLAIVVGQVLARLRHDQSYLRI